MKPPNRPTPTRMSGPVVNARTRVQQVLTTVRAWRWGAVIGRAVLGALGLVVLGAIGQSALARNVLSAAPPVSPPSADAGSLPAIVAPPVVPSVPSAAPPVPTGPPLAAVPSASAAEPSRGHATPEDPVYLNQATLADLHRLPGIGPKRAEAILALRARLGHFRQIEDLLKVKGVGRSSLKKLRPLVRLDPPPAPLVDAAVVDGRGPGP